MSVGEEVRVRFRPDLPGGKWRRLTPGVSCAASSFFFLSRDHAAVSLALAALRRKLWFAENEEQRDGDCGVADADDSPHTRE